LPLSAFLVEDSALIRDNLIPTLQDLANVRVTAFAESESDAVAWLSAHGPQSLVIVDLFLKEGSGLGVLARRGEWGDCDCLVMLTNYATVDVRRRCLQLGADAVFDKSSELDGFLAFCASHCGRAGKVPPLAH
jgi:two-component system OmpR family response regulator